MVATANLQNFFNLAIKNIAGDFLRLHTTQHNTTQHNTTQHNTTQHI